MTSLKTTASALTIALLASGGALADAHSGAGVNAQAQVQADADMTSDALEGTSNTINKAGELTKSAVKATGNAINSAAEATGNAASTVANAAGDVGADVIFNVETAFEAGTTQVTSTDGVQVGRVTGVRMIEDGGQMVTVDLNDDLYFSAERVSISSSYFVKGDGVIGLRMSQAELEAQVENASKADASG
jgi:hypothetical protein